MVGLGFVQKNPKVKMEQKKWKKKKGKKSDGPFQKLKW